jgi:hypothetical protein
MFLFSTTSRPVLGPTQPPIHWVPGALSAFFLKKAPGVDCLAWIFLSPNNLFVALPSKFVPVLDTSMASLIKLMKSVKQVFVFCKNWSQNEQRYNNEWGRVKRVMTVLLSDDPNATAILKSRVNFLIRLNGKPHKFSCNLTVLLTNISNLWGTASTHIRGRYK